MSQVPEESYTQAQFRQTFKNNRQFVNLLVLGSDSSGTHVSWEDSRGERHFGVISDLTGFRIVRAGSQIITIPMTFWSASATVTLSPALPGAVGDYLTFAHAADSGGGEGMCFSSAFLTDLSTLTLIAGFGPENSRAATSASHAHGAHVAHTPTTHSSIDVTVTNPHTHDDHVLTHAAHTGGSHIHEPLAFPLSSLASDIPVTVNWMIVRAS